MRIDHVTIATDDLETTVAFYRDVLGLVVGPRPAFPFAGAWLYANGRPIVHLRAPGAEGTPMRHSMLCSTRTISLGPVFKPWRRRARCRAARLAG